MGVSVVVDVEFDIVVDVDCVEDVGVGSDVYCVFVDGDVDVVVDVDVGVVGDVDVVVYVDIFLALFVDVVVDCDGVVDVVVDVVFDFEFDIHVGVIVEFVGVGVGFVGFVDLDLVLDLGLVDGGRGVGFGSGF